MKPRIDYWKTAPDRISALSGLENYVRQPAAHRIAVTTASRESRSKRGRDLTGSQ
jgi:hypothetical protein